MAFKTTQNTFEKGMSIDNDPRVQAPGTYRDARNITITGDGDFYVAKNISSSTKIEELTQEGDTNINILGAFECKGTYGSVKNPSIITFIHLERSGLPTDLIVLYDIIRGDKYELLVTDSNTNEGLDFPSEGTIDAVVFGENNVDNIYFDDHVNPLRSFEITNTAIPNARSLTTQPLAPVDKLNYRTQRNGSGQLESGSYQISYRYYNTDTKKYSTWSPLTNSIPVYPLGFEDIDDLDELYGGVPNESTKKSIVLSVDKSSENSLNFNAIQLAIVKNTGGLKQPNTVANLTAINTSWYTSPEEIVYDGGGLEEVIDSQELVTEDAAIKAAKTLVAKDNVLFRGNVEFHDRTVDSVTFSDAKTIKERLGGSGAVYNPLKKNTNNPSLILDSRASERSRGNYRTDIDGTVFGTQFIRIRNSEIKEGGFGVGDSNCDGERLAGRAVNHDIPTDWANIGIPSNLLPGNVVWINLIGDQRGLITAGGSDFAFSQFYHNSSNTYILGGVSGVCGGFGSGGSAYYTTLANGFRYIVQPGDSPSDIASNIAVQLNSVVPSGFLSVSNSGSSISFNVVDTISDTAGGTDGYLLNVYKYVFDLEFGMLNGVDDTIGNDPAVFDDLVNNEDSKEAGYKNHKNAHKFKGYFRDEVYRFGLTYMDKYGNWSRPVPFDFSNYNARVVDGDQYGITLLQEWTETHTTNDTRTLNTGNTLVNISGSAPSLEVGDLVYLDLGANKKVYTEVRGIIASNSFIVEGSQTKDIGYEAKFNTCIGGEYSWADGGIDWKFPKRGNGKFPMMSVKGDDGVNNENNTFIQPLGLRIEGITNHPEWAVAMSVVRVRRLKNILWQSPVICTNAYMPALLQDTETTCATPVGGSSPIGSYSPKSLSKGTAYNIERDSPKVDTTFRPVSRNRQWTTDNNIPKLAICVPPEYMYQNDGINYGEGLLLPGASLDIVDAVSFFRTNTFNVDGDGADTGVSSDDRLAIAFRADIAMNYYYKDISGINSFDTYPFEGLDQIPKGGSTLSVFYGAVVNLGGEVSLPAAPVDERFQLKEISSYGNLEATSIYNCSNEVDLQKAVVIETKDSFGDFCYYAAKDGTNVQAYASFDFGGEYGRDGLINGINDYNITETVFTDDGSNISPRSISSVSGGTAGAVPIVNLVRDINDDRYGTSDDVHQFISTGVYETISSTDQVIDVDVWGGDCFISKHAVKIADTHLDVTPAQSSGGKVFAYNDFQEILITYLESEVNCDLQASQFTYPVLKKQSLQPFSAVYPYTYNPGYSVENELKVWTSVSITEENRLEYPSRIYYSDQKIFQTDVEGFDRFRAFSFYDLPEDYGGITKMTKLPNDNVYVIQESAVAVLPINKQVIEDSTGGEMVINSSTLINTPTYLLNKNGSQHIRSVQNSDDSIFFMDAAKREIFKIGGQGSKISDVGMYSVFQSRIESNSGIPNHKVISGYDLNNNEYWIGVNDYSDKIDYQQDTSLLRPRFISVWSDKINAWMTDISLDNNTEALYKVYSNSLPYLIGTNEYGIVQLESLYTNDSYGELLGSNNQSIFKIVINPEEPIGKTFDVMRIDSNNRLSSALCSVTKEDGVSTQFTSLNLNRKPRHDGYEVPMLLDANNARLRGKYCNVEFYMDNGNEIPVNISSVLTKYRISSRVFR